MVGKVIGWVCGHLVAVVCVLVVVVSLPVAYVMSGKWGHKVREEIQKKIEGESKKVERQNVSYSLARLSPGMEAVEVNRPPNDRVTDWFGARLEEMRGEGERVTAEALAFNRRGHVVLVEGLFPEPGNSDDRRLKPYEFLRALMGYRKSPSVVDVLMERVNGGVPPDSLRVATKLQDERTRFVADLERKRGPGQNLSEDEQKELTAHLRESRINEYRRQAGRLGLYVDPGMLGEALEIPQSEPATAPPLSHLFEKQWNVWIASDILDAIALANTDERGRPMRVGEAVVKRLLSMKIKLGGTSKWNEFPYEGEETVKDRDGARGEDGLVGVRDEMSLTGRYTHPDNDLYDVVEVRLEVIGDATRLPRLLEAFSETNFMSVLDMDLEAVDVWKDLEDGYVYGDGSIVKATLTIETVWLREWTVPMMPAAFREGIGAKSPAGDEG